jgi:hypothetical protein
MKSPASRIALSAALSIASMTVPAVHADDDPTEAPRTPASISRERKVTRSPPVTIS